MLTGRGGEEPEGAWRRRTSLPPGQPTMGLSRPEKSRSRMHSQAIQPHWAARHLSSTILRSSPSLSRSVSTQSPSRTLSDEAFGSRRKYLETGSPASAEEVMEASLALPNAIGRAIVAKCWYGRHRNCNPEGLWDQPNLRPVVDSRRKLKVHSWA